MTFQVGGGTVSENSYPSQLADSASAKAHDARPSIPQPSIDDPKKPVYVFLYWDPGEDISPSTPPEKSLLRSSAATNSLSIFRRVNFSRAQTLLLKIPIETAAA